MPDWTAFGAVAGLVLSLVLGLAWITSGAIGGRQESASEDGQRPDLRADAGTRSEDDPSDANASGDATAPGRVPGPGSVNSTGDSMRPDDATAPRGVTGSSSVTDSCGSNDFDSSNSSGGPNGGPSSVHDRPDEEIGHAPEAGTVADDGVASIPTTVLLANVLFTHGGLGVLLLGAAAMTGIPADALGVSGTAWSTGLLAVGGGLAAGVALAFANVAMAVFLDRIGLDHDEGLRTALAPDSGAGWAILLLLVLPLVAAFEELLFRAVLIGAAAAATGLSPWLFVLASSIAFALGHGLQGRGGILVTGLLGGALGVAFVLTNSLLLVAIAHYVVNAAEFLLKEWLGLDLDGGF